jgi:hypothetical protein
MAETSSMSSIWAGRPHALEHTTDGTLEGQIQKHVDFRRPYRANHYAPPAAIASCSRSIPAGGTGQSASPQHKLRSSHGCAPPLLRWPMPWRSEAGILGSPKNDATLNKQPSISFVHEPMPPPHSTADAVAQMIAGIVPVGLDAGVTKERSGDVAMRRPCQRAVERTKRETHAPMSRLDGKVSGRKLSLGVKMIQTGKRIEPLPRPFAWEHSVGHQSGRLQQAALGQRQLQMMAFLLQEYVLIAPCPFHQDDRTAGQCAKIHCVARSRGDCSHGQHVGALARRPEDACFCPS